MERIVRGWLAPVRTAASWLFKMIFTCFAILFMAFAIYYSVVRNEELKPRTSPPHYPNAQQVAQWTDLTDESFPKGLISFRTTDSPEKVQSFYREFLLSRGWEFGNFAFDDRDVAYFQYWPPDGPVYKVLISAESVENGETRTIITMTSNYHNWYGEFWNMDSH